MATIRRFIGLAGLPRSGSTLLSAILCQNPNIHAEGNSAVCQLTWDTHVSCIQNAREQLMATGREMVGSEIVSSIWKTYYRNVQKPVVVDKCRSWTLAANLDLMRRYITDTPKIIVLERPAQQIMESFRRIHEINGRPFDENAYRRPGSEPLMRSLDGVNWAKQHNNGEFLFVKYHDLVNDPTSTMTRIYDFIEEPAFSHDFDNIVNPYPEDDSVYGLIGLHEVRRTIGRRNVKAQQI